MKRILAIDDDADVLLLITGLLGASYSVTTAQGGAAGLRALSAGRFDLVLLDLSMPGVDGAAVKRSMDSAGDRTPVLLLSGEADLTLWARRLGAAGALAKPVSVGRLEAMLERVLAARAGAPGAAA